jgi:very-short-patch-repair endonuclease
MADLSDLHDLAEQQHGLATTDQLHRLGFERSQIDHLVARGLVDRVGPRLVRLRGAPETPLQALMARVLDAGPRAALSHTTALAHWGVRGFVTSPVHVVRHRDEGDRPARGTIVHEVRSLPVEEVRQLDGIPVVSPALGLLQLAGMRNAHPARVGRAIDAAWADRMVSYRSLDALIARMSQRGRPGLGLLRELVQERGPAYVPPASNLEARVAQLLVDVGLPQMRRQVDSGDGEGWIGRVDFRATDLPVILEVQSERFHVGLTSEDDDRRRRQRLGAAGFEIVEVTDVEIFHRPEVLVERIGAARSRAGQRQLPRRTAA